MEHISLSLPRRSFSSNSAFTSHKSVYDDVFGGPPKLGLPTLAPRFEDYSEIFGGFHTSQSSSIPFLHLPFLDSDDPDIHFDIDYTEVFGGCGGFNLTASPEDLVGQSSGGYDSDSPDEPWSPAQSVPLSDELDPVAGSDKSHMLSDVDSQQSLASINKQNASYNKSSHMSAETVLTSTSHVGNLSAVPGYAFSLYESPVSWDGEDEHCPAGMINKINYSSRHGARVIGEKQYECSSNPIYRGSDIHRNDSKLVEKHEISTSVRDKPFVTVSDISLRTKPSRLPPPSRPPPVLVDKKRECVKVADGNNPLFFDMEIDGSIAMEGRGSGNKNVKANHQGTTELNERKYFRSLSAAEVEEKTSETVRVAVDIEDENSLQPCGEKNTVLVPIVEEKIDSINHIKEISVPLGAVCCDNTAETVAWRESTEYFELQAEAKCYENEVEVRLKQQDSPKQTKIRFVDSQKLKETNGKNDEKILVEEFHRKFEDVEGAEMREIVQERMVAEGTEKDMDMVAEKMIMHELASRKALEQAINDKYHKLSHEVDVINKRNQDVSKNDNEVPRFRMPESENVEEAFQTTGNMKVSTVACSREETHKLAEETDSIDSNGYDEREVEWELDDIVITEGDQLKILEGGFEVKDVTATKVSEKHDIIETLKSDQTAFSSAGNVELRNKPKINNAQFSERVNISYNNCEQVKTESIVSGGKMEDVSSCLKHNSDGLYSKKDATTVHSERKDSNTRGNLSREDRGGIRRETVPENEHMRKMEEEREREREREKDRMAVDKAALEARERSYFEARERAERAAVERATVEVRKRAFAEAQERLEKASMEARLRSDRAAVERATAEARQRAAEKLMAQKAAHDSLDHVERLPDRFSNCLRYPYSSAHDGTESESPQRCKARLERYRRTAERAANALAEKNRRDHLAQREREERNRVAESLDTEVKRWSSGKEGNLRALLSTLQYILGPDSGWHPLSLTEVITSAAVKKAYRRATLCVHPDKLQQRGATIQQKYICEKVFDLLKEAWNKFNSEER